MDMPKIITETFSDVKEENLWNAWDKYFNVNKKYINDALLKQETYQQGTVFPLDKARRECGQINVNDKKKWVWDVFFPVYPFFRVLETGNGFTKKLTEILIIKDKKTLILDSTSILEKYFPCMDRSTILGLNKVDIDLESLDNYIRSTESYLDDPEKSESLKNTYKRYIQQAKAIREIVTAYCDEYATKKFMLPYKTTQSIFGREYHKGVNLQNCSKVVRKAALGACHEYDINSSIVAVKLFIYEYLMYNNKKEGIEGKFLTSKAYLTEKDSIRKELAKVLHQNRVDRHHRDLLDTSFPMIWQSQTDIKKMFTAFSFGAKSSIGVYFDNDGMIKHGSFSEIIRNKEDREAILKTKNGFLQKFINEQEEITEYLFNDFMGELSFRKVIDSYNETFKPRGRISKSKVMAYIYQQFETKFILKVEKAIRKEIDLDPCIEDKSNPIILKIHDGFYIRNKIPYQLLDSIIFDIQYKICRDTSAFITMSYNQIRKYNYSPFSLDEYNHKKRIQEEERQAVGYFNNRGEE